VVAPKDSWLAAWLIDEYFTSKIDEKQRSAKVKSAEIYRAIAKLATQRETVRRAFRLTRFQEYLDYWSSGD